MKKNFLKALQTLLVFSLAFTLTSCWNFDNPLEEMGGSGSGSGSGGGSSDSDSTPTLTMEQTPLTFEAAEAGAQVTFETNDPSFAKDIEYSLDGTTWTAGNIQSPGVSVTLANAGDKVMFRGTNAAYADGTYYSNISCDKNCYIYGNIMSLIKKEDFENVTTFTANYTFRRLFDGNTHIKNHTDATKYLVLPATTLTNSCYNEMFKGCSKLIKAPALPATTLANSCYNEMFSGCSALTPAPELPAPTLASSCYNSMFENCTGLTTTPVLNVDCNGMPSCLSSMFKGCTGLTTVAAGSKFKGNMGVYCCPEMFSGCTTLASVPSDLLPATTLNISCYNQMFNGCEALTAAPALPATTLTNGCYHTMFKGCIALTETPKLPAETTVAGCYMYMFQGCTSLNVAWVKAAFSDTNCGWMFNGCNATEAALHTQAGNVGGWNGGGAAHVGSFVADNGWVD